MHCRRLTTAAGRRGAVRAMRRRAARGLRGRRSSAADAPRRQRQRCAQMRGRERVRMAVVQRRVADQRLARAQRESWAAAWERADSGSGQATSGACGRHASSVCSYPHASCLSPHRARSPAEHSRSPHKRLSSAHWRCGGQTHCLCQGFVCSSKTALGSEDERVQASARSNSSWRGAAAAKEAARRRLSRRRYRSHLSAALSPQRAAGQ
jgi:hypothetical protein